jgi:hypothetical protein
MLSESGEGEDAGAAVTAAPPLLTGQGRDVAERGVPDHPGEKTRTMVPPSRIERETSRATIWRSNQLS